MGLKTAVDLASRTASETEELSTLASRQLGLLSRIAPVSEVQAQLYEPGHYRSILQAVRACSGVDVATSGPRRDELLGHLIRTLASLNQPPKALLPVAKEVGVVEAILNLFPEPRRELGKVTPESVTLLPKDPVPALLIGNAARCLMPLADDTQGSAVALYTDRRLLGVEKLVCAMATCQDIRVRRNISIILAKGCRLPGVRELVTEFRGMQMMIELNKEL